MRLAAQSGVVRTLWGSLGYSALPMPQLDLRVRDRGCRQMTRQRGSEKGKGKGKEGRKGEGGVIPEYSNGRRNGPIAVGIYRPTVYHH